MEDLKSEHATELEKLNKKLRWYSENQQLLDRDLADLKDKREEIKELRTLVDRLESENKNLRKDKVVKNAENNSDQTKMKDLQRQVTIFFVAFPYLFVCIKIFLFIFMSKLVCSAEEVSI